MTNYSWRRLALPSLVSISIFAPSLAARVPRKAIASIASAMKALHYAKQTSGAGRLHGQRQSRAVVPLRLQSPLIGALPLWGAPTQEGSIGRRSRAHSLATSSSRPQADHHWYRSSKE